MLSADNTYNITQLRLQHCVVKFAVGVSVYATRLKEKRGPTYKMTPFASIDIDDELVKGGYQSES